MQNTTASLELQEWATAVLDKPVQLIEDLDPDHPDSDRPFAVSMHEAVDIGGLDVLLNACKQTLLDSKPPIRLNVVQEMNPPEALVKNLKKTLGVRINADGKGGSKQKVQGLVLPDSRVSCCTGGHVNRPLTTNAYSRYSQSSDASRAHQLWTLVHEA